MPIQKGNKYRKKHLVLSKTSRTPVSLCFHRQDPKIDWNSLKTYTPTQDRNVLGGKDKNFGMVKEVSINKWVISIPAPKSVIVGQGEGSTTKWGSVLNEGLTNLIGHKI